MHTARKSEVVVTDLAVGPHLAPSALAIPIVDEFYNFAEKAPHPDAIVPKRESRWWFNREMRKKKKVEERANAALELQRVVDEAVQVCNSHMSMLPLCKSLIVLG